MVILAMPFFFGQHFKASIIKGLSLKIPQKMLILVNTSLSTPPRPPIAPYRHVTLLDRQTYTDTTGKHTAQMVSV